MSVLRDVEANSEHPLGKAVAVHAAHALTAMEGTPSAPGRVLDFKAVPGRGVACRYAGNVVCQGNELRARISSGGGTYMCKQGIAVVEGGGCIGLCSKRSVFGRLTSGVFF